MLLRFFWHDDSTRVQTFAQDTSDGPRLLTEWRTWPGYSEQERVAAEFAHRFGTEHTKLRDDEDFWSRCNEHFSEELLADLALSCALWVGMGRMLRTLDIGHACKLTLPSRA